MIARTVKIYFYIFIIASFESARKNAADANDNTTDEERLGRGKRQHVPFQRYSSDNETDDNNQCRQIKSTYVSNKYVYALYYILFSS